MRLAGQIASLSLAAALAWAAPAAALPPGVFADPGSPAGKEYQFPLGSLRGAAVGHVSPAGLSGPLFGVGIGPSAATARGAQPRLAGGGVARSNLRARSRRAGTVSNLEVASLEHPRSTGSQVALITAALLLGALALGGVLRAVRHRHRG